MRTLYNISCFIILSFILTQGISVAQTINDGVILYQQGKFAEARTIYELILKNDDKNAEAHYRLGQVLFNRAYGERNVDDAVDQLEKAVDLVPDNADYQFLYGAALGMKTQSAGIIKKAFLAPKVKRALARAVELDPKHVQARIGLAQYYLMAPSILGGDDEEGWKQLDEAIKLDEIQGRLVKASMLAYKKENDKAEKELKRLVASKPNEWRGWKGYGYLCFRMDRYDEAVKHFKRYVEIRPDTADSFQSLAEALLKKGDVENAMVNLKKSLELDDNFVPAIITMGEVFQAKGQKKEAKESYQKAISITHNDYYRKQAEKKLGEIE